MCCGQESTADDGEEDNPLFVETGREAGADPVSPGRDARYLGEDTGSGPAPRTVGGREQIKGTFSPPIWAPCHCKCSRLMIGMVGALPPSGP